MSATRPALAFRPAQSLRPVALRPVVAHSAVSEVRSEKNALYPFVGRNRKLHAVRRAEAVAVAALLGLVVAVRCS